MSSPENAKSSADSAGITLVPAEARDALAEHGERLRPILAALSEQPRGVLVGSREVLDALSSQGHAWSERTLRLYLAELTELGLAEREGRRGHRLTDAGFAAAREHTAPRRLGSILHRMEETMCQVTFDLAKRTGTVSINAYFVPREYLLPLCDDLEGVFRAGWAVGDRVLLAQPGEDFLGRIVPDGCLGLGTICSLTVAALCLRRGIPAQPQFGGLLQVDGGRPAHFLEMIRYDATSLSPNEVFIRANFTSVHRAVASGSGAVTASFREVPMHALPALRELEREAQAAAFPGILALGRPGQQLLNVPVHEGRVGLIFATGLNPLASLWEHDRLRAGTRSDPTLQLDLSRPMIGPAPYEAMVPVAELRSRALAARATAAS